MKDGPSLKRLFHPSSIAVVGGAAAEEVIRQCRSIGFSGEIWPVNRQRKTLEGLSTFASVLELPHAPDAAFIAVPREDTISVVAALARMGAGGAVCYASGFAEAGGEGRELQARLVAQAGAMPLLGPNCYGILNYLDGCALWPDLHGGARGSRGVAILTQSGNIALNLTLSRRHLPLGYVMALGNQAKTTVDECMGYVLEDERVSAIGIVLEGLGDVAGFADAAQAARERGVPVVALKLGRSAIGAELAASHTRSLVGSDRLYRSFFDKQGVAVCDDLETFVEALKLGHVAGCVQGTRVVATGCSGGDALLVADIGEAQGLSFPPLSDPSQSTLCEVLGPLVPLHNPLDYQTYIWEDERALTACFSALKETPADVQLLVLDTPASAGAPLPGWDQVTRAYIAAQRKREGTGTKAAVPVLVSSFAELLSDETASALMSAGIAPLQGLPAALGAIRALARAVQAPGSEPRQGVSALPPLRPGRSVVLGEAEAKEALAKFGLRTPRGQRVRGEGEALTAAEKLGWPVALKSAKAGLTHKSELGGVKLNLRNAEELRRAAQELSSISDEFLVEEMGQRVIAELLVGITRDEQFGLALTLGAGGVLVELLDDTATVLLPARRAEFAHALASLKLARLLFGYRGKPAADVEAILDSIEAVARYAEASAETLVELDVNPLLITESGCLAVDALIRLARA